MSDEPDGDLTEFERRLERAWRDDEAEALRRVHDRLEAKRTGVQPRVFTLQALAAVVAILFPILAAAGIAAAVLGSRGGANRPAGAPYSSPPTPLGKPNVSPVPVPSPLPGLLSIHMDTAQDGWGLYGTDAAPGDPARSAGDVVRTIDGGRTWAFVQAAGARVNGNAYFQDSRHAWVVRGTVVWRTADGGSSWGTTSVSGLTANTTSAQIEFVDPSHGWLMTADQPSSQNTVQGVRVLRTADGGAHWQTAVSVPTLETTVSPNGISSRCGKQGGIGFRDANSGWLAGGCLGGISFYVTHDGGFTWSAKELNGVDGRAAGASCEAGPCDLLAPTFFSSTAGIMRLNDTAPTGSLASETIVYRTSDGGATWSARKVPVSDAEPLFFLDPVKGWLAKLDQAAGEASGPPPGPVLASSAIEMTNSAGQQWSPVGSVPAPLRQLQFLDARSGWALAYDYGAGRAYGLYRTFDGGHTWTDLKPSFSG